MCTYNGEKYIREQIDSIVSQSYPIYEFIIQDDCSTDNTLNIIQEYAKKYSYIKVYQNPCNIGFNQNFKQVILKAKGDFIAISDQDDIWYKEKLKKQIEVIGEYSLCTSERHRDPIYNANFMTQVIKPIISFEYLLFTNSIPGHSMLLEKKFAHGVISKWNAQIIYDWWFSINAHLHKGIICINEPLNWHRPHNNSIISLCLAKNNIDLTLKQTWQSYIYGYKAYRKLQQLPNWNFLYRHTFNNTSPSSNPLIHILSNLLLKKNIPSLFYLCWLCLLNRDTINPCKKNKSFIYLLRSFFCPLIRAYTNKVFYL